MKFDFVLTSCCACEGPTKIEGFFWRLLIAVLSVAFSIQIVRAQGTMGQQKLSEEQLAQEAATPSPELTSIQMIYDFNHNIGPFNTGTLSSLTITPTLPFKINQDWNIISRSNIPVVRIQDVTPRFGSATGLSNIQQTFFLSPVPTNSGLIWGVGPSFFLPTATDRRIGSPQTGTGPAFGFLQMSGHWVVGFRATQIWHAAGPVPLRGKPLNFVYMEPMISYTTEKGWTYALNSESVYDWSRDKWLMPVNFTIEKLVSINSTPVNLGVGVRYYAASPNDGPKGWGVRLLATILKFN